MTAAALGTTLELPTLEADVVAAEGADDPSVETSFELDVRPGTQSGTEQVLRGRGVPGLRGGSRRPGRHRSLVETPTRLDPRAGGAAARAGRDPRRGEARPARSARSRKGVFGRLRDAFNPH